MLHTTRTVGILGGMGPAATVDFYRRLTEATFATCDQEHLHVLIDSYPFVPDRTDFLLGSGKDPTPQLISIAHTLESYGAELLVIACNTANVFADRVAEAVHIPLVNWGDATATSIAAAEPDLKKVGLLATTGTVTSALFQRAFARVDIDIIKPDALIQEYIMSIIYGPGGVKAGMCDLEEIAEKAYFACHCLEKQGAEAILLACTELSWLAARRTLTTSLPVFDAAQLVAERVVVLAGGQLQKNARACNSL